MGWICLHLRAMSPPDTYSRPFSLSFCRMQNRRADRESAYYKSQGAHHSRNNVRFGQAEKVRFNAIWQAHESLHIWFPLAGAGLPKTRGKARVKRLSPAGFATLVSGTRVCGLGGSTGQSVRSEFAAAFPSHRSRLADLHVRSTANAERESSALSRSGLGSA
jgi:hypothetical protein